MKSVAAVVLLAFALLLSGCADPSASEGSERPTRVPTVDPELEGTMIIAPSSATPGQEVALRFPADSERGIAFSLSHWTEGQWDVAYYLTSDWGESGEYRPSWWPVEDSEDRGWEQVGISGAGPDRVFVPDTAAPGDYLLCTANAVDEACALLTVTS